MTEVAVEEREAVIALAREFAEREIRPRAAEYDERGEFPWDIVEKAAEVGLTSYDLPTEYGGAGIESLMVSVMVHEELLWGDAPIGDCISGASFFAGPIVGLATPEQKQRWVAPLCTAPPTMGAVAITEPQSGSDAANMRTTAKRVDGGYVLNGQKTWCTNALEASFYAVFAATDPAKRSKGISLFVLERDDEGFEVGKQLPTMGSRCERAAELFFDNCFVPDDRLIGEEGAGFIAAMKFFDRGRVELAGGAVGLGRAALEYAVEYAKERHAFGQPIHEYQAVSFRLVDAKLKLDQARQMAYHAARLADEGKPYTIEASMAKIAASEAAWFATCACVETLGGYGYSREYPAERWLRNAKLQELYEGTNDIQRLVIARSLFR
jgi:acyl-CoA dehydrogenase